MKLTPFPLPLNIGTDVVHLPRIHRLIHRRATGPTTYLHRFIHRILCPQELHDFQTRFLPPHRSISRTLATVPGTSGGGINNGGVDNSAEIARWLAGRFAAKEAARKAAPGGAAAIGWKEVMVRVDREGSEGKGSKRPEIVYLKDGGRRGEVGRLSISHDGEYVVATVLAAG
ncbi:hypothetical protein FQN50_001987 [Emmonsiellopsis sp. PD_5]|nr:hypothetical protein FQN50_001987 [Emmonsiellopsis sp. PD_5]